MKKAIDIKKAYESGSVEPGTAIYELVEMLSLEMWLSIPATIIGQAEGQEYDYKVLFAFKEAYGKADFYDAPMLRFIVEIIEKEMGVD